MSKVQLIDCRFRMRALDARQSRAKVRRNIYEKEEERDECQVKLTWG